MTEDRTTDQAPEHWDKGQMEIDDAGEAPGAARTTHEGDATQWNKGELAEERQDGSGGPHTEDVEVPGGLSGGGSNPGGGERWADRDRER